LGQIPTSRGTLRTSSGIQVAVRGHELRSSGLETGPHLTYLK
jgi:hypothetical protein